MKFLIAVLFSCAAFAAGLGLTKSDFSSATQIQRDGKVLVSARLSPSGVAKFRKLNANSVGKEVHGEIGGVQIDFKLRAQIAGESMEMGPFSPSDAAKVVEEINLK